MSGEERWRILRLHVEDQIPLTALARETGIGLRTLQRWKQLYRDHGITALNPHPRADAGTRRTAGELVAFIERLALTRPRPALTTLHRLVSTEAERRGLAVPSYATVRDIVQSLDPALVTLALDGPAAYRDRHELVYRRRADRPNEIWQADHTELDILITSAAGGKPDRPWLTIVIDDHSRAICGYTVFTSAPSAMNTALALRQAIWRKPNPEWIVSGIPEQLYVDNGSDFISEHIEQACIALKIRLIHSLPGRPRGRGKIERLFRTINDMFLPDLPGHLIAGKPLSAPVLTLDELRARFEAFVCGVYHRRPHGSTGEPPITRWQKGGFLPAMPDSLEQLDMLLVHVPKPRKVLRDGIRLMGRRYVEPTLAAFVGEQVEAVYDPRDLTEIHVYHQGRFVCRALSSEHAGHPSLRAIQRARRGAKERDKQVPAPTETFDGDQEDTASRPTTYRGLRLYAADD